METPDGTARVEPKDAQIRALVRLFRPLTWLARPVFRGFENIPHEGPLLFVGNHTLFGLMDIPFMYVEMYRRRGIVLRGLADHLHFKVPAWRGFLGSFGVVPGTREDCGALLAAGESVLVFPGGAREVAKRKGEQYKLVWKQRIGFAKMAIQHQATIVPFSAVGMDDAVDIAFDADDILRSPLGRALKKLGVREDAIMPIAWGLRLERFYFRIGTPIPTDAFESDSDEACWELRRRTAAAIEDGIDRLLEERAQDPQRRFGPRAKAAAGDLAGWLRSYRK